MKPYTLFIFIVLPLLVMACANDVQKPERVLTETVEEVVNDEHNAANSLDVDGTYKGILPCADCEGIVTRVVLNKDHTAVLYTQYQGKDTQVFEVKGNWSIAGNIVNLALGKDTTQFFAGENHLRQLDKQGKTIEGELADKYILNKE